MLFAFHQRCGDALELAVNVRRESVEGGGVALGPGEKKLRGFRRFGVQEDLAS
jgi:hypothetical protein